MRGIGSPHFESGDVRSAEPRSGRMELGRSGNTVLVPSAPGAMRSKRERRGVDEHGAPRRAVVVYVRDINAREAELVECRLARRGFAVDVADERGLDRLVRDPWIEGARAGATAGNK